MVFTSNASCGRQQGKGENNSPATSACISGRNIQICLDIVVKGKRVKKNIWREKGEGGK